MCGFENLKDILSVIVVPMVIFGLGALIPRWLEKRKRNSFIALIKRELDEMAPKPDMKENSGKWHLHLKKRFIHEAIFEKPSDNRDFILSLPPKLAYDEAQLWIHYEKAKKSTTSDDLAEHGASWCDYLKSICEFLDGHKNGSFCCSVYTPWVRVVLAYHPDLEKRNRLTA